MAGKPKSELRQLDEAAIARKVAILEDKLRFALRRAGRLLLIRPVWADGSWDGGHYDPGYTEITHPFTDQIRQKALDEGWDITDLSGAAATRANVELALGEGSYDLIIHCDHGGNLTLCCQNYEAGLDCDNIDLASGSIVSTTSCRSASGLGPFAIGEGVRAYLGYTDVHTVWSGLYAGMFAAASYAAHLALLECSTAQQAFDAGWAAYDQLYNDLLAMDNWTANNVAPSALHDRDCFSLIGTSGAVACPGRLVHCPVALPDMQVHCMIGNPDMQVYCAIGHPYLARCSGGQPLAEIRCSVGHPDAILAICVVGGANIEVEMCTAGPPLIVQEILEHYPYDLIVVDMDKVPEDMRKPFRQMIDKMRAEH